MKLEIGKFYRVGKNYNSTLLNNSLEAQGVPKTIKVIHQENDIITYLIIDWQYDCVKMVHRDVVRLEKIHIAIFDLFGVTALDSGISFSEVGILNKFHLELKGETLSDSGIVHKDVGESLEI